MVLLIFLYIISQQFGKVTASQMGKKQWSNQEIQLLQTIKLSEREKNWKMISKMLAKKGYKRTEQECRHKWVNCLSPEINHGPWSDEELATLYREYEQNLSRWSVIQKHLANRTQIKIKNHFYGVLRNIIRFILKYFKRIPGRETETSNRVNPNILKSIYWGQGDYDYLQEQVRDIVRLMGYRFNKQILVKVVAAHERVYRRLGEKILEEMGLCRVGQVGDGVNCENTRKAGRRQEQIKNDRPGIKQQSSPQQQNGQLKQQQPLPPTQPPPSQPQQVPSPQLFQPPLLFYPSAPLFPYTFSYPSPYPFFCPANGQLMFCAQTGFGGGLATL